MNNQIDVIQVALKAAGKVLVHARGNPAQVVSVGVAAGLVALAVGVGYGFYKGGGILLDRMKP